MFLHLRPAFQMSFVPDCPDATRVWIHTADAPLDDETQAAFVDRLEAFVDGWTSHGHPVQGGATVLHDRFVVLAGVQADGSPPSGCAIDEAARAVDETAEALGVSWVPALHVVYRTAEGPVAAVPRPTFQERAEAGAVTADTTVFDPSVTTLGALRDGAFERPADTSWHGRAFDLPQPA
jgi:hypothetical protein